MMNQITSLWQKYQTLILVLLSLLLVWLFQFKHTFSFLTHKTEDEEIREGFHNYSSGADYLRDGKYIIRGSRNQRFCSDDPNGIICNRDEPGPWEVFQIQHLGKDQYAIRGSRSDNWCSLTSTGLSCNSPVVGDWEVFNLRPLGNRKYGVQSDRNQKWCVDSGHGLVCDIDSMYGGDFQEFEFLPIRYNNIK